MAETDADGTILVLEDDAGIAELEQRRLQRAGYTVEVASTDEVASAQRRLAAEGLATAVEDQVTCCHALQDKVWVDGPDGEPWEIYTVLADVPATSETTGCC